MAVQAQYPSNVLLLNRIGQENLDYVVQPQPEGFLDQSHGPFNNGVSPNPLKRGRQNSASITELMKAQMESFGNLQQSHSPNLLDLSQLQSQQQSGAVVSTGLRLANTDQQQLQQNHYHQHNHQNLSHPSQDFFPPFSDDFVSHMKQERREIEQLLQAHAAELWRKLTEKRQRQYHDLLSAAEESVARSLREKETEIENAKRRKAELEARAAQLTVEAQIWEAKARTQEATAVALQAQLQRSIMGCGLTEDQQRRFCFNQDGSNGAAEDAESAYIDPDRVAMTGPSCYVCKRSPANVVSLPCRHLCLCKGCDQAVQACPLCLSLRNFTLEVNFC